MALVSRGHHAQLQHARLRAHSSRFASCTAGARPRRRAALAVKAELFKLGDAWVAAPRPEGTGRTPPPVRGIVHFLGGAFAGAAPQVVYSVLMELLASAGYTVIATPYAVTFKHLDCADMVHQRFLQAVQDMRRDPLHAALVPPDRPLLGVGHSNGSLLHLLINARNPGATQGNVIMSYNNKPLTEAVPIPGLIEMSATMAALRGAPLIPQPDPAQVLQAVARMIPAVSDSQGQISGASLAIDQLNTVLDEVGNGFTEFTPSPAESRKIIAEGYDPSISPVLLVRFSEDTIDGTHEIEPVLQSKATTPQGVSSLTLPGSHNTPCAPDLTWGTGPVLTPWDALALIAKLRAQQDVRRVGEVVVGFLDRAAPRQQQRVAAAVTAAGAGAGAGGRSGRYRSTASS